MYHKSSGSIIYDIAAFFFFAARGRSKDFYKSKKRCAERVEEGIEEAWADSKK